MMAPAAPRIVLATANPHKAQEISDIVAQMLGDVIELVPRPSDIPDVAETADSFEGNARLKARALLAATGLPALADDSGLQVDALGGAPGVHSARFAGDGASDAENVALLLRSLEQVGSHQPQQRRGRFVAVVMVVYPDGTEIVAEGNVPGTILPAPTGAGGFGYDPVFAPDGGDGRSFAELAPEEKHRLSHRGRALRSLADALADPAGRR